MNINTLLHIAQTVNPHKRACYIAFGNQPAFGVPVSFFGLLWGLLKINAAPHL